MKKINVNGFCVEDLVNHNNIPVWHYIDVRKCCIDVWQEGEKVTEDMLFLPVEDDLCTLSNAIDEFTLIYEIPDGCGHNPLCYIRKMKLMDELYAFRRKIATEALVTSWLAERNYVLNYDEEREVNCYEK